MDTSLYAKTDSVIVVRTYETYRYSKKQFNKIINKFPELYEMNDSIPYSPDVSYDITCRESSDYRFGAETGHDEYNVLYAYFLKKRMDSVHCKRLETMIQIYEHINNVYGILDYGGTFYGHTGIRIDGYAAYSVYMQTRNWYNDYFEPHSFDAQKKLYLASLKQLSIDEVGHDNNNGLTAKQKKEKMAQLFKEIRELNALITDGFYLRRAQRFQYTHYVGE